MATLKALLLVLVSLVALKNGCVLANFVKSTWVNWGSRNAAISADGKSLALMLNNLTGSGIQTKKQFLFGSVEMLIKLVPGNSAGTVTSYYMSERFSGEENGTSYSIIASSISPAKTSMNK